MSSASPQTSAPWRGVAFFLGVLVATLTLPALYAFYGYTLYVLTRSLLVLPSIAIMAGSAIAIVAIAIWCRRRGVIDPSRGGGLAALGSIAFATAMIDSDFPAKYIHLPQYLLVGAILAICLRGLKRSRMSVFYLLPFLMLAALIDESLQGYHPRRTFGLVDVAVDCLAGIAGAFAVGARGRAEAARQAGDSVQDTLVVALFIGAVAVTALLLGRAMQVEYQPREWMMSPLVATIGIAMLGIGVGFRRRRTDASLGRLIVGLLIPTGSVVVLIHVCAWAFYPGGFH